MGHIAPHDGTAAPYRRERTRVDKAIEKEKKIRWPKK